jgi:hypothetical protein
MLEPDVSATRMDDDGLVLLAERAGKFYRCNATGADLWAALDQHQGNTQAAAELVADRYGVHIGRVEQDLEEFIGQLRHAGLARVRS